MNSWKFRYSVFLITDSNKPVPADDHSVVEKEESFFGHGAHYLLESTCPDKGLLSHRCVKVRILLHCGSLWFLICNLSTIFRTLSHIKLYGFGKGKCFLETRSLSKLHMLSYETIISPHSLSGMPSSRFRRY